jgi:hypothetical protein
MRGLDAGLANAGESMEVVRQALARGLDEVVQCSTYILTQTKKDPELPGAVAFNYMMLLGNVVGGWQLARGALIAQQKLAGGGDKEFLEAQVLMAKFYAEHVMPRNHAHAATVRAGSASIMALAADGF